MDFYGGQAVEEVFAKSANAVTPFEWSPFQSFCSSRWPMNSAPRSAAMARAVGRVRPHPGRRRHLRARTRLYRRLLLPAIAGRLVLGRARSFHLPDGRGLACRIRQPRDAPSAVPGGLRESSRLSVLAPFLPLFIAFIVAPLVCRSI
jgi:hypothetical protein